MEYGILTFVFEKGFTRLVIRNLGLMIAILCSFLLT